MVSERYKKGISYDIILLPNQYKGDSYEYKYITKFKKCLEK